MSEWKEFRMDEIALIVDCEHKTAPLVDNSNFYSVRTSNISNGKIDFEKCNRVSQETYQEWTKREIPTSGDLVLAREAPVGEIGLIKTGYNVCLGQRTVLIRIVNPLIFNLYLLYYLINPNNKNELIEMSGGSVVSHLNMKDIRSYSIRVPNIVEQTAIASVLSSLDDKIDLLNRQNATLEKMAETLFRQWFVVEAKEEWEEIRLGSIVEVINGVSYKSDDLNPSAIAMVTLKSFDRNGGFRMDGFKEYTGKYKEQHILKEGDLVVAHTDITQEAEVIGNPVMVIGNPKYETLVFSMDLVKVISKSENYTNEYIYLLMKSRDFKEHCLGYSNGSTVLHLSKKAIPEYEMKLPPESLINEFSKKVKPLVQKQLKNQTQIRTLTALRDTLLPKLMSGEVRIKN